MLNIELEQEDDGRWIAEIPELPGVMVYGSNREEAEREAMMLAFLVLAERLRDGEPLPENVSRLFKAA